MEIITCSKCETLNACCESTKRTNENTDTHTHTAVFFPNVSSYDVIASVEV